MKKHSRPLTSGVINITAVLTCTCHMFQVELILTLYLLLAGFTYSDASFLSDHHTFVL